MLTIGVNILTHFSLEPKEQHFDLKLPHYALKVTQNKGSLEASPVVQRLKSRSK